MQPQDFIAGNGIKFTFNKDASGNVITDENGNYTYSANGKSNPGNFVAPSNFGNFMNAYLDPRYGTATDLQGNPLKGNFSAPTGANTTTQDMLDSAKSEAASQALLKSQIGQQNSNIQNDPNGPYAPSPNSGPNTPGYNNNTLNPIQNNNGAIPQGVSSQQPQAQISQPLPQNPFSVTLQNGSKGSEVANLQKILNSLGANLVVDGDYGPKTAQAVKDYQAKNGLTADGIFGPITSGKLTGGINAVGNPQNQPSSTLPTPFGTINPNANVSLPSATSPTFDSSNIGSLSTSDVLNSNQSNQDQINAYLKQQADAYTALNQTKVQALQGQADIMYGRNGAGGSDASLQGAEQAMFDRQMAFRTVPAEIAYNSAQMALSLFKQTPAYLTETQARDTAFNMLQSYPDINYAYNPQLSAQQNLQAIKESLPSSAKYQSSLMAYKGYVDVNGVFHMYNSKNPTGAVPPNSPYQNTPPVSPTAPAPTSNNPVTPSGTYLGVGTSNLTAPQPLVDKATTRSQVDFVNDWNSGKLGTARNALGTALGHLFEADSLFGKLNNSSIPMFNSVSNFFSSATGKAQVQSYETAQNLASNELAAAYGGNSQGDREKLSQYGGANQSPAQHAGYITTATNLLASKLSSMAEQYRGAFGHYPSSLDSLISPLNQVKLRAISGTELGNLVNGVHVSPSTQALINSAQVNKKTGQIALPIGINGAMQIVN